MRSVIIHLLRRDCSEEWTPGAGPTAHCGAVDPDAPLIDAVSITDSEVRSSTLDVIDGVAIGQSIIRWPQIARECHVHVACQFRCALPNRLPVSRDSTAHGIINEEVGVLRRNLCLAFFCEGGISASIKVVVVH